MENSGFGTGAQNTPGIVINSPGFQTALASVGLREALVAQGIDPKRIAERIDVLLNAHDHTTGEDDYTAIDKGLKHATAIYGITDKPSGEGNRMTYNFIFSPDVQGRVREMDAEIKQLLKNAKTTQEPVETQPVQSREQSH